MLHEGEYTQHKRVYFENDIWFFHHGSLLLTNTVSLFLFIFHGFPERI